MFFFSLSLSLILNTMFFHKRKNAFEIKQEKCHKKNELFFVCVCFYFYFNIYFVFATLLA